MPPSAENLEMSKMKFELSVNLSLLSSNTYLEAVKKLRYKSELSEMQSDELKCQN